MAMMQRLRWMPISRTTHAISLIFSKSLNTRTSSLGHATSLGEVHQTGPLSVASLAAVGTSLPALSLRFRFTIALVDFVVIVGKSSRVLIWMRSNREGTLFKL